MEELERQVRSIELDGLLWGACKFDISIKKKFLFFTNIFF
jgi:hypothetical protein